MKIIKLKPNSPQYPESFRQIADPPKEIYILGNIKLLLEGVRLAVVGSRKVSPYGRSVTQDLVNGVASRGVIIVSGLALGVDAIAHKATLGVGGKTIAVLAGGLDKPYPATNLQLARDILNKGGALISEYPKGTPPLQHHFIARNRLVSALSDGVLITEAAEKSGTLHTAGFALDQGKSVMAVPGNITSEQSKGTNNLIKVGAAPILSVNDILQNLGRAEGDENQLDFADIIAGSPQEAIILELLKNGITDGGELMLASKLESTVFSQTLTMLEITGKIRTLGANHWSLNKV